MAASSNTPGQPKYDLRYAFDGLRSVLPAPAASDPQVYPVVSSLDALRIAPPTTASTSAASSSGSKHLPYDVFINHCGQDVKHTVANSIYNSLVATGLRVFLDKDEMKHGDFFPEALEEAMGSASLHIAIFSENYAQSPNCLAELAFMVQTGTQIIPVFYHVEPSDLIWAVGGKGIYADAFSMYERKGRYTPEEVQRWKQALHEASFYAGHIIRKQDDEQKEVKNVVNRVLKELKVQLDVAKYLVGLDEIVQDFDKFAHQSAGSIQIVGICGMGGVGKTTLAKEFYKKKCSTVDRSSFLFDLSEAARKKLLHEKQNKLMKDLRLGGADFDNVEEGTEILKKRLTSVSTLMVLDDVDHTDQLDALLPARESLGDGSLIIVTTRELPVLKAWGVSVVYKMRALNSAHAEQLFCWHAFQQPSPLLGFESLTKKLINVCHGLPLSLKVLGGQLYREYSENYWQSQLDKLSRIVPEDIKLRLKISYDALDEEEKEMFLDIACFFIGCRSSCAIAVWDGPEWNGMHSWQRLVNKCLVDLDESNFIRMHDHLRDLGREIANQQSPYRLWSPGQIIDIHPQQEAIRIRGIVNAIGDNCYPRQGKIIIRTSQGERSLAPCSLGLKIFVGDEFFIEPEYSELSRELVWLQCNQFEHKNIPSWLSLEKLRVLELFNSRRLEDLWERDEGAPLHLRELVIQRCSLRGFPRSIGHLKSLKKILLGDDYFNRYKLSDLALSGLPEEFCNLQSLEHLEIKWCGNLSFLPSNFGELTNLQHLNLNGSTQLKMLPDSFKKLALLEYLNLEGCNELIIKPELLENMTKLRYLNLNGCRKLKELGLPEVASLTELYLKRTSLKELPANIFQQTKLTKLEIGIGFLKTLPTYLGNLSSLTRLAIQGCRKLESLPDSLEHLNFLRDLDISGSGVKCLPKSFIHLQSLQISDTPISELSFGSGCMLKTIYLCDTKVSKISISEDCCPFLETLELIENEDLRDLETLPATLKNMYISYCNILKDIRAVRGLKNLQKLKIENCEELDGLPCFAELVSLQIFTLQGSSKVKKLAGLQELRSLRELRITELDELPSLAELTSLKIFELQECHKLEKIEGLGNLRSLETLRIYDCPELDELPSLAELTSLKIFELNKCHKLEKIEGLGNLRSLGTLWIYDCPELDELPSLAELTYLKIFELQECHKLEKMEGLGNLRSLETLRIYDCPELDGLTCFPELTSLKEFDLRMCHKLEKVEGLERWRSLETLKISDCPELYGLPSLAGLTSLKKFDLRNCHKLEKLEGLERLRSLEKLELHTRWKAPCMVRWEQCERLKSLVVVANDRSAVEPFISNIEKCPREVIICMRAVFDVGSLKSLFEELPNVSVLHYDVVKDGGDLELRRPESSANANAILICFIIDFVYPDLHFTIESELGNSFETELGKGKWVWMGVFTQASYWLCSNEEIIWASTKGEFSSREVKVESSWLVTGEKGSIVEALHQLFQRLGRIDAIKSGRGEHSRGFPSAFQKVPLVGLDEAVQEFDIIALQCAGPIQIVGISGMGGSGKTMLAKEIYNRKSQTVRRSTFLSDVRDAAEKRLLVEKQKKLLEDLDVEGSTFDNEVQGKQILQNRLRSLSVLIILDDVNHTNQLEALLPAQQSLGVGSLIIVTTRDLAVLKAWGISAIYQMGALNDTNAKELFCWHAFSQPSPVSGFEDLVEKFISASHGLPLSLEVLGGQVRGKSMSYWEDELNSNSRKLPENIKQRLIISYDRLDEEEKQMFLDTACFFIGEENSLAIAVWDGSEWNGLRGWESLFNKHLVYLDENNRITMHDHLRDLGREIADQQSPYRLWSSWQLNQIQPQQEHIEIRGMVNATGADCYSSQGKIIIDTNEGSRSLTPSSLGLKLFVGSGEFINEEVGELSRELLWLRWDDFNHTNLPPWLSLKNLRVLQLNGALSLQELWMDDAHAPLQLRELVITGTWSASFERFPRSISYLKHLKKIALLGYVCKEFGIKELPEEFCDLQSLEHLELRHCKLLSTLPTRFGELRKLRHLDLFSCEMLRKLPDSFEQLVNLKYLDLSGCKKLSPMPDILENMRELENLYFSGCPKLQELPRQIAEQKNLRELHLKKTMLMDVPDNIDQLSKLETLVIGSPHLTGFPESLGNLSSLTRLKITRCIKLESLPESVERLKLLEYLCIKSSGVRSLPEGFRQLTNLQNLKIFDCPIAELDFGSASSSSLGKLKAIHLKATDVTRLSISQNCCPNLETLQLELNRRLLEIDILSSSVKTVKVYDCKMLRNLNGIPGLVSPETFEITGCPRLGPDNITAATRSAVSTHSTERFSFS